jgi:hypothetical protein
MGNSIPLDTPMGNSSGTMENSTVIEVRANSSPWWACHSSFRGPIQSKMQGAIGRGVHKLVGRDHSYPGRLLVGTQVFCRLYRAFSEKEVISD